jgi:hypothetical protein
MGIVVAFAIDVGREGQNVAGARGNAYLATFAALGINNDCSLNLCHTLFYLIVFGFVMSVY